MQLCIGKIKLKLLNAIKLQLLKASVLKGYFRITEVGEGGGGGGVYLGLCFKC